MITTERQHFYRGVYIHLAPEDVEDILITELKDLFKSKTIGTRWDVVNYCIGRFGYVDEAISKAISLLYRHNYIDL